MRASLVAFSLVASTAFAQVTMVYPEVVNLDQPGVLDELAQSNPEHYSRIVEIRHAASFMPCRPESVERTLKAKFDADEGRCGQLLLASYPAKMELGFRLEGTYYTTRVELDTRYDRFIPAVDRR